jgi:hypothetical protein
MKLKGVKLECPNEEILVIPRLEGDIVLKAKPAPDWDQFEKICPEPSAPFKTLKGGVKEYNFEDTNYLNAMTDHSAKRMAWIILKSLEATEDLEWESVDMKKPGTYLNYAEELKAAGFCAVEINRIVNMVLRANSLDEAKLESARRAFLAGQAKV